MPQLVVVPLHFGRLGGKLLEQLPDEASTTLIPGKVFNLHAEVDVDELVNLLEIQKGGG